MDIIEVKEENEEKTEKTEDKNKPMKQKFLGFMNNVFNKVKTGTIEAAKKVGKGITDLKIKDKLKVVGNTIAGVARTSGHLIADTTTKAFHKTKEGMDILSEKTKNAFRRGSKDLNQNPKNKQKVEEKKLMKKIKTKKRKKRIKKKKRRKRVKI